MQLQSCSGLKACVVSLILRVMLLTEFAVTQPLLSEATSFLAGGTFRLTVTDRDLSLDAREASLTAILAEISQRTGIPIVTMHSGVDERITIHLSQVPLDKALKQLAPNVAIATAKGPHAPPHQIAKVYVLPKGQTKLAQSEEHAKSAPFQFTFDPSQH